MDLFNEKRRLSLYFNTEIRTAGEIDALADWAQVRPEIVAELTDVLGTSWQIAPIWLVDKDTKEVAHAHAIG